MVRGVGRCLLIAVVRTSKSDSVWCDIAEPSVVNFSGSDDRFLAHWEKTKESLADCHIVAFTFNDLRKSPSRNATPLGGRIGGREDIPVAQHVAKDAVGDVVRCQSEVVDS
ncbi:unannotated protein [freshwater metagenome]|uniref:Unannotated protein n=1 Tax=freshwater metagenome TaxID=449393 RepID=A0A6J7JXV8_9ZZZZ